MKNKIEITSYNPTRAKWYFALFKFLELFGVFLFTFGFYGLGCLVLKHCPWFYNLSYMSNSVCTSYLCIWFTGFLAFFSIFALFCIIIGALHIIYIIIQFWIKSNWNLAKKVAEDKTAKAKRLKEEELIQKRADRKKYGYCVGDEAKVTCVVDEDGDGEEDTTGNECIGRNGEILEIRSDGTAKISNCNPEDYNWYKKEFKITKKQPLK